MSSKPSALSNASPHASRSTWVRYAIDALLDFGARPRQFVVDRGVRMIFRDRRRLGSGFDAAGRPGLVADAFCLAADLWDAVALTRERVDGVAGMLSLSTGAAVGAPVFHRALDMTPGTEWRDILQSMPWPGKLVATRRVNDGPLKQVWTQFMQTAQPDWPTMARAVRWLRKSLLETDHLDRFLYQWIGLETLAPLVKHKHGLRKTSSVRHAIVNLAGLPPAVYDRAYRTRQSIAHGRNLDEARREAPTLFDPIHVALVAGILDALGVPEARRTKIVKTPLPRQGDPSWFVLASIRNLSHTDIVEGRANPHLTIVSQRAVARTSKREASRTTFKLEGCSCEHTVKEILWQMPGDTARPVPRVKWKLR